MIERIGQLFITGFEGAKPSRKFLDFIASENIGGIILFEEQCNPHPMAEDTIRKIFSVSQDIPFVAVDQEGGRVCRFRGAPAEYPAPSEYGKYQGSEHFCEAFGRAAYYIRSLGVNILLGPVADLAINKNNKCLENRTFGDNPARVIPLVEQAVKIMAKAGLLSCLKHFPGLGAAKEDPHLKMAVADYDLQTFLNREALTFKAGIDAGADMVMTTHLHLPSIDDHPVMVSQKIINLLLRDKLNFDGVVITDDLLMKGSESMGDYSQRAIKAFKAGHDILLFGRNFHAAKEAIKHFKMSFENGEINADRLATSLDRISGIKSKLSSSVIL